MNPSDLTPGVLKVVHRCPYAPPLAFNLSVFVLHGVTGVAAFQAGQKPPRKGKHLLLTPEVRQWVEEMEAL